MIATALAVPLLGEKVGPHRWTVVMVGLIGMLIIIRPGAESLDWSAAVPLIAVFLWALYQTLVRKVGLDDAVTTTALYTAVVGLIVLSALAPASFLQIFGYFLMV